jgi:hypothetical protein
VKDIMRVITVLLPDALLRGDLVVNVLKLKSDLRV